MGGHEFQWTYNAHYYDCDARRQLTPFALLRYCEDISLLQSEEYGVGLEYYEREQMAWILSRWDVRIHRLPRFRDSIYVTTQPMNMRRFLANRRFAIHDAEGSVMVEADSQWIFLDTERKRPMRIPPDLFSRYGIAEEAEVLPMLEDPRPLEQVDVQREFSVRMSDIDTNGHVNNIRYVEWAYEALPPELVQRAELKRLMVQYKKEVHYGVDVLALTSFRKQRDHTFARHEIRSGELLACAMESHWQSVSDPVL